MPVLLSHAIRTVFLIKQASEFPDKLCSLYRCPNCTDIFVINKNTLLLYFVIHTVNIFQFLLCWVVLDPLILSVVIN